MSQSGPTVTESGQGLQQSMQCKPAVAILFFFFFSSSRTSRASVVTAGVRSLGVPEVQPTTAAHHSLVLQPMLLHLLLEQPLQSPSRTCSPCTGHSIGFQCRDGEERFLRTSRATAIQIGI